MKILHGNGLRVNVFELTEGNSVKCGCSEVRAGGKVIACNILLYVSGSIYQTVEIGMKTEILNKKI